LVYSNLRFVLGTWAEHNVINTRMKKAWESYFMETVANKKKPS